MTDEPTLTRLRIHYSKLDALRYTGHLDMHHAWERTLRRARLPLAYSQGFHPQPRVSQACALPLGFTSRAEVIDIWFEGDIDPQAAAAAILKASPPGLEISQVEVVDLRASSLQSEVCSTEYTVEFLDDFSIPALEKQVSELLTAPTCPRERRGKTYDLRPLVEEMGLISSNNPTSAPQLWMKLSARDSATGRPEEVLDVFGIDPASTRIQRVNILFRDGLDRSK